MNGFKYEVADDATSIEEACWYRMEVAASDPSLAFSPKCQLSIDLDAESSSLVLSLVERCPLM